MKVCLVTHDNPREIGGASSGLMRLLPFLRVAGIELELHVMAARGQPGVICAFCEEQGIPLRRMPSLQHLPYAVNGLLKFLEEGQPDIYIPNHMLAAYYAAGYAKCWRRTSATYGRDYNQRIRNGWSSEIAGMG